ncbi:MAG: ATP-dependent DNA helicase [bacterium]|nr:ATP-dependent DNA helicase [bacterium]
MISDPIKLNTSQRQAVEYTSGPLLIVAGAGTGKTNTLVEKIKYLISEKLAKPEEILCLTFTEKAAYEMEERVDKAMPYGYFQMWISTFHKFADEVLRNDIYHMGLNPAYNLMTQAQSILFLKKNLFQLDLKYFRPVSNPNKFIEGLLQHFSRLHDEDISPEEYGKWVRSPTPRSARLEDDDSRNHDELDQYAELASAYSTYQKLKLEHDVMDFDDLIYYAIKLFRERPNILKQYQKKFKYVLVDEFQDTNIAQYELIKLLCPPDSNQHLTVVGDDSQAIYKFRGASVSNIMTFMEDYKTAHQVSLLDNYRSNQTILNHAYRLIQNNNPDTLESKLGISKELVGHAKNIKDAVQFELFSHGNTEADWIADTIKTLHETRYTLSDFAILVRANSHSDPIINALKRSGIPYQFLGPGTLFKQPEVKDLIAYLQVLSDLDDTVSLYRVLSMELFELEEQDVVLLMSFAKKTSLSLFQALEVYLSFFHDEWRSTEHEIYKEHIPLIPEKTREKLIVIIQMIKNHLKRLRKDSAGEILYEFLADTGYLSKLSNPENEYEQQKTLNVTKFFQKLKNMENEIDDTSVFSAVEYIKMSIDMGESPLASDSDAMPTNAVNILTVHGAKGLEFPVVFMPDLIKGRFPTNNRREQIPIPDALIKEKMPSGDYHIQEERRLFYVGLTRAKERLFLSASEIYGEGVRKNRVSPFVGETVGEEGVTNKSAIRAEQKEQLSIFDFKKKPESEPIPIPTDIKNLSHSQINTYEMCPLKYKYQYVLKIPTGGNAASSFGSSIHHALHKFYKGFSTDRSFGLTHLMNLLETSWIPVGYRSRDEQSQMKEEARHMLENYFHTFHSPEIEIMDLEKLFKIRVGSDIFLTGKIDRVDTKADGTIEIIDYKTGKMPDEKKLKKDMQLAIYAMAASDFGLYHKPIEKIDLSFYYLQHREKITLQRTEEDIHTVKMHVREIAEKIREGVFPAQKSKACDFCDFKMICEAWQ